MATVTISSWARPRLTAPDVDQHEPVELVATGDTYEQAKEYLDEKLAELPEGWVLLGIDRVRPEDALNGADRTSGLPEA